MEVSEYLVGSPAFKAGGTGDPRTAGSIPVHLRCLSPRSRIRALCALDRLADGEPIFARAAEPPELPRAPSTGLRTVHPGPERPVAEGDKSGGNTRELRRMIRRGAPIGKAH